MVLFVAAFVVACSPLPEREIRVDLLAQHGQFSASAVLQGQVDLGTPGAGVSLLEGWKRAPKGTIPEAEGLRLKRSSAQLQFLLSRPDACRLTLRYRSTDSAARQCRVSCNGDEIGDWSVSGGNSTQQFSLPTKSLVSGKNIITLALDEGPLETILWTEIQVEPENPLPSLEVGQLTVPGGSRCDFYLRMPEDVVLECEPAGNSAQPLQVLVEADGIPPQDEALVGPALKLRGDFEGRLCRLSLIAPEETVVLKRAALMGPKSAPKTVASPALDPKRPLLLMLCVDTLRADRLGSYIEGSTLTPSLDQFALESVRCQNSLAQSGWTKTSVASILTGAGAWRHGNLDFADSISEDTPTLAETLRAKGYHTVGVVASPWLKPEFGFSRGFDTYEPHFLESAGSVTDAVLSKLRADSGDKPLFVFAHYMDPHDPYAPPKEFLPEGVDPRMGQAAYLHKFHAWGRRSKEEVAPIESLYDAEVRYLDQEIGRLFAELKAMQKYDSAMIVVCSDHGEAFGEHDSYFHSQGMLQPVAHTPLLVRYPGGLGGGKVVEETVQHADIVPTILDYLQLGTYHPEDGTPIGDLTPRTLTFLMELGPTGNSHWRAPNPWLRRVESAVDGGYKLQVRTADTTFHEAPTVQLFDFLKDPEEGQDLTQTHPVTLGFLWTRLRNARQTRVRSKAADPEAVRDSMRSLPYLR